MTEFLDGRIPAEYLYDNPSGKRTIAPSADKIRENTPWLAEQEGWIVWEWTEEGQKIPHRGADPRRKTEWQEPGNQAALADAWDTYQNHDHIHGVGFVFNGTEPEILEDFDDCLNPWAFTVSNPCLEDALENDDEPTFFSSSGTGAHRYPVAADADDTSQHPHEVYIGDGGNNRWAAVTGWKISGDTHGPDRSARVDELSEKYNEAEAKAVDVREFDFDADPADVDADAPVPEAIREAFDGDVPRCVGGLIHVLGTHDPTDPDGPGWGQQTFMRYSHLLMLLAAHLDAEPERLAELTASFKAPAITTTQRGGHPKKPAQAKPYGEGVPWDLDYQAGKIGLKVVADDLAPPSTGTIAEHCNVKIDCDCDIHRYADGVDLDEETVADYAHVIDTRRSFETIDDLDLPEHHSYVLDKPPRAGGSYAILQQFAYSSMPFMVLAPRHAILDYHVETVSDLVPEDYSIVHLEGKARVCDHGSGDCPKMPDGDSHQEWRSEARNVEHRGHVITPEDVPAGVCKYWFLSQVAEYADVVLTVPQIARRVDRDRSEMNLFIDEEQTIDHFQPGAVDLVTITTDTEADGRVTIKSGDTPITRELKTLRDICDRIEADQQDRAEDGRTEEFRETPPEADIKAATAYLETVAEALGVTAAAEAADGDLSLSTTIDELESRVDAIDAPERQTERDRLFEAIDEYCKHYYFNEEVDPSQTLKAALFPYTENRFHFKRTRGDVTCRLVGDRMTTFHPDWFGEFNRVAMIAGPAGERFLEDVREDTAAVELTKFTYDDRFVVIPIGKRVQDGDRMEKLSTQRKRVRRLATRLNKDKHPFMAVTGTKRQASGLHDALDANPADVVGKLDNPERDMYVYWTSGQSAIIYENSIVSRGIDAPYFDVTLLESPGFATPYWEARAERWKGEDDDEYLEARAVAQELKDRELTNAALRMSHTYETEADDTGADLGTKFIVCAVDDAKRLKYLHDRVTPKLTYADQASELLQLLTARGEFQTELEDFGATMGKKSFTLTALEEQFHESPTVRPEFDYDEVAGWVESGYLNQEIVERVLRAVRAADPPTTSNIKQRVTGESGGRVMGVLNVLERKGAVFSTTGESTGGRPPTVWQVTDGYA